jgi:hypothetical protein
LTTLLPSNINRLIRVLIYLLYICLGRQDKSLRSHSKAKALESIKNGLNHLNLIMKDDNWPGYNEKRVKEALKWLKAKICILRKHGKLQSQDKYIQQNKLSITLLDYFIALKRLYEELFPKEILMRRFLKQCHERIMVENEFKVDNIDQREKKDLKDERNNNEIECSPSSIVMSNTNENYLMNFFQTIDREKFRNFVMALLHIWGRSPLRSQNTTCLEFQRDIRFNRKEQNWEVRHSGSFKTAGSGPHGATGWELLPTVVSKFISAYVLWVRPQYKHSKESNYLFLSSRASLKGRRRRKKLMKNLKMNEGLASRPETEKNSSQKTFLTKMNVVFNQLKTSYLLNKTSLNNDCNENMDLNSNIRNDDGNVNDLTTTQNKIQVPFGIHNLRKKTATVMSTLLAQGKITFEDYNNFVLSELHDVDTSERYYVEQVWGPNRMRPVQRRVLYSGSIEEVVKNRSEHIKKGK